MTDDDRLPPMDADLLGLLRSGAPRLDAPPGAEERIFARLATTLPLLPGGGGGGGAGGDGGGGAPAAGASVAPAAGAGAGIAAGKVAALVVAALVVGGGVGSAITTVVQKSEPRVVYVDRPLPGSGPAPATAELAAPSSVVARVEDLPSATPIDAPRPAMTGSAKTNDDSQMSAERALLDPARASFARGEYERALAALEQHKTRYAAGLLTEEREALAVRTLAALGRPALARERGKRFVARYPESLMLPAVEAAMHQTSDAD
jgi:hypothetical protein